MLELLQIMLYDTVNDVRGGGEMDIESEYSREGYLNEDFRLFHLCDQAGQEFGFHYHEFDKIVFFLSGSVTYHIEGISYPLKPGDILLINQHLIHRADINTDEPYERIIFYISTEFVERSGGEDADLMRCFRRAERERFYLLRPDRDKRRKLSRILSEIEENGRKDEFASSMMRRLLFVEMMIQINRVQEQSLAGDGQPSFSGDPKITDIISYINKNLGSDLNVELLAERSFVSKYHFMRMFKEQTGYTVHNYIQQKRLLLAADMIKKGAPVKQAAAGSGFSDYSAFQRAFKKMFGITPSRLA